MQFCLSTIVRGTKWIKRKIIINEISEKRRGKNAMHEHAVRAIGHTNKCAVPIKGWKRQNQIVTTHTEIARTQNAKTNVTECQWSCQCMNKFLILIDVDVCLSYFFSALSWNEKKSIFFCVAFVVVAVGFSHPLYLEWIFSFNIHWRCRWLQCLCVYLLGSHRKWKKKVIVLALAICMNCNDFEHVHKLHLRLSWFILCYSFVIFFFHFIFFSDRK